MKKQTKRLEKSAHVTWKKLGEDRSIVLDLNSGRYFSLNKTATAIWQHAISDQPLDQIAEKFSKFFNTDQAAIEKDIQEVTDVFVQKGLLSEMAADQKSNDPNEEPLQTEMSQELYFKPEIQEHEPITQVTAGTSSSSCGSHYWYPN